VRCDSGNHLALVAAVDLEVTVEREDDTLLIELRHPDQAGIGQRHGDARELFHERPDGIDFRHHMEVTSDESACDQFYEGVRTAIDVLKQEARFRKNWVAGQHGRLDGVHDLRCPRVVALVAVEQCDERTSVDDD
jgi:hypothetical protein